MTILEFVVAEVSFAAVWLTFGYIGIACHMDREEMLDRVAQAIAAEPRQERVLRRHKAGGPRWRFADANPYADRRHGMWQPKAIPAELIWPEGKQALKAWERTEAWPVLERAA